LHESLTIRRDQWGIPHIDAANDEDAWFGLGFCQGQDRSFQLTLLKRLASGRLAEMIGPSAVPMDRLSRRIGFAAGAREQLAAQPLLVEGALRAFAAGVTAGVTEGREKRAPAFVLARSRPLSFVAEDVIAILGVHSFLLASNWDLELTRLKIFELDGPQALADLDPEYAAWLPTIVDPGRPAGPAIDRLAHDVEALRRAFGHGGGSNNWAIHGQRTASGRPQLANDPHLPPFLPPHWYLCHLTTPQWSVAGASFAGVPSIPSGHNGHGAWGVTAAHADNVDVFLHTVSEDGRTVKIGDTWHRCERRRELIHVRGADPVVEDVLITPHGPIIGPALAGEFGALSLQATWMTPQPVRGLMEIHRCKTADEARVVLAQWPAMPLGFVWADTEGTIAYQLVGQVPVRGKGGGYLPMPATDPDVGWVDTVPASQMPYARDPESGYLCTANNRPTREDEMPYLGVDWLDGYRAARIDEVLSSRRDFDVYDGLRLQIDETSLPWREMKESVLEAAASREALSGLHRLLDEWDGVVSATSAAATVYELLIAEMSLRVCKSRAPRSWRWAMGAGFTDIVPHSLVALRRVSHLVRLMRERPDGWFARGWVDEIADALAAVNRRLRSDHGPEASSWRWGDVRQLTLVHPITDQAKALAPIFNLGPFPWGGDQNTVAQSSVDPLEPLHNPIAIGSLRMVVDVGDWSRSRFILPGGQSGNPLSPHYDDQLPLWRRGQGIPIAWEPREVERATEQRLFLEPRRP
jgi:penicillin amidase